MSRRRFFSTRYGMRMVSFCQVGLIIWYIFYLTFFPLGSWTLDIARDSCVRFIFLIKGDPISKNDDGNFSSLLLFVYFLISPLGLAEFEIAKNDANREPEKSWANDCSHSILLFLWCPASEPFFPVFNALSIRYFDVPEKDLNSEAKRVENKKISNDRINWLLVKCFVFGKTGWSLWRERLNQLLPNI